MEKGPRGQSWRALRSPATSPSRGTHRESADTRPAGPPSLDRGRKSVSWPTPADEFGRQSGRTLHDLQITATAHVGGSPVLPSCGSPVTPGRAKTLVPVKGER